MCLRCCQSLACAGHLALDRRVLILLPFLYQKALILLPFLLGDLHFSHLLLGRASYVFTSMYTCNKPSQYDVNLEGMGVSTPSK